APRYTGLRSSRAASSATRDSSHSGGTCGTSPICRHYPIRRTGSTTVGWGVFTASASRVASRPVRAATIRDGKIAVEDHPDPTPQAGELLVRVHAAGLNGADMIQLAGRYPAPPGAPQDIPGLELAGEVAEVGRGVTRFEVGDRVMAVVAGGGQAELAVVHES